MSVVTHDEPAGGHYEWTRGIYYCDAQSAVVAYNEVQRNDFDCPWCGENIIDVVQP